jgi:glycine/D-amino acid oxidase-like deaminating enzyme
MDLRSGETIWRLIHGPPEIYAPLQNDAECDVVIIGGGITGALIGYELTKSGLSCIVIDKAEIGGGSTSASTALLSYELDTPLCELAKQIGDEDAAACYRACLDSIEKIHDVVREAGAPCDFTRRQSVYLAESEKDVSELECEVAARRKHGMNVELLRRPKSKSCFHSAALPLCWPTMPRKSTL